MGSEQINQGARFIKGFQGLRGYAILLIFISHCDFGLNERGGDKFTYLGAFGVELFVVLSGYLLMQQHADKPIALSSYLKNKVRKFGPLHWLTLAAAIPFSIASLMAFDKKAWFSLLLNGAFVQAWAPDRSIYFSYNSVSWYLSLTLFLSAISPCAIAFWKNKSEKLVAFLMLVLIGFEFVWYWFARQFPIAHWLIYIFPLIRSIDFILGAGLWRLAQGYRAVKNVNMLLVTGAVWATVALFFSTNSTDNIFTVWVWVVPSLALILAIAEGSRQVNLLFCNRVVLFLGSISFELFLIHQLCIRYLSYVFHRVYDPGMIPKAIVNLIAATAIAYMIKKVKRRYNMEHIVV